MSVDQVQSGSEVVCLIKTEGDKSVLSFRNSSLKRFVSGAQILGHQTLDDDVVAVVMFATEGFTEGLFALLVESDAPGWRDLVRTPRPHRVELVHQLLAKAAAAHLSRPESQQNGGDDSGARPSVGRLSTDGIFISVECDGWRDHFPLSSEPLPILAEQRSVLGADQMFIGLALPDGRRVDFLVEGSADVVSAEKAIALMRSKGAVAEGASVLFNVPPAPDPVPEVEKPRLRPAARFAQAAAVGDPATYDAAVAVVYPYLGSTSPIAGAAFEKAEEVAEASGYLLRHSRAIRGQGFESLRSLSRAKARAMMSDPRDSIVAKLAGRALMGRGDDDSDVLSMIDVDVAQLQRDAIVRLLHVAFGSTPESIPAGFLADSAGPLIVKHLLGVQVPPIFNEQGFARCFDAYRELLRRSILAPGVVGNLMASSGRADFSAMRKADKRASRGSYSASDLQALKSLAVRHRPTVRLVAQYQRSMGWAPTSWDPVQIVESAGQYW